MRTLLLAIAFTSAALCLPPPPSADACGDYAMSPRVYTIATYRGVGEDGAAILRTFVLLWETEAPQGLAWSRVAPRSYHTTMVAHAAFLDQPMELTLVGPSGSRTVQLRKQVFIAPSPTAGRPWIALEVALQPREQYKLAIAGGELAAWRPFASAALRERDLAWLAAQGIRPETPAYASASRISGTDLELLFARPANESAVTTVRRAGQLVAQFRGEQTPTGAFVQDNMLWLVVEDRRGGERVSVHSLGAITP